MINILKTISKNGSINFLDIKLASILTKKENPLLILIFTLLCFKTRIGNICLNIDELNFKKFFKKNKINIQKKIWKKINLSKKKIIKIIKKNKATCTPKQPIAPIILSKNKLYFQKMWKDEQIIINFFKKNSTKKINKKKLKKILNKFFHSSKEEKWQKIAIVIAITNKTSIISGGPGTGKTTIITKILLTLIKLNKKKLQIKIGAPTGKAASRITESINKEIKLLKLKKNDQMKIPKKAETIHRILGFQINSNYFFYNKHNNLSLDVLIIDESSMIDLNLMARLIESLPNYTRLILIGDKNQLTPVQSGSIFKDLCYFTKFSYSKKKIKEIKKITNYNLKKTKNKKKKNKITDITCILKENYRFNSNSKIHKFANAIQFFNIKKIKKILNEKKNIKFKKIDVLKENKKLIKKISKNYYKHLQYIKKHKNHKNYLNLFNFHQILTTTNIGPCGVIEINKKLENNFQKKNYININSKNAKTNYQGQPIIINKNNYSLKLFNGELGIILKEKKKLKAFFKKTNGKIKKINLNCLPKYETAYSITIHKSQGSEFNHISIILPEKFNQKINKELIYTAITRAKKSITIYGKFDVFIKSIKNITKKNSGLIENLIFKKKV